MKTKETNDSIGLGALDGSSIFTREYAVTSDGKNVTFSHLDDLLEFIQEEMLIAEGEKEMVVSLRRTKGYTNGKSVQETS
jgi:hypothetical protein